MPSPAQSDNPFGLCFSIHNPSNFFSAKNVIIQSRFNKTKFSNESLPDNLTFSGDYFGEILPTKTILYKSPMNQFMGGVQPVDLADVTILIGYKTLGIQRTAVSEPLSWDNVSKQWVIGKKVN